MKILNKRAKFDYELIERIEAGVVLTGEDVKLLMAGKVSLQHAYAKIIEGEVYLIGSTLPSRKLLLHRDEIQAIEAKIKAKKLTLVPVKMYNKGRRVKLEIALARSKKKFEKKETIKRRDIEREMREKV